MDQIGMTLNGIEQTQSGEKGDITDLSRNITAFFPLFLTDKEREQGEFFTENHRVHLRTEIQEYRFRDIHCWYCKSGDQCLSHWQLRHNEPVVQLFFCLNGSSTFFINGEPKESVFALNHNLSFASSSALVFGECSKDTMQEFFVINLCYGLFVNYFPLQQKEFSSFNENIRNKDAGLISERHMPTTPEITMIINDILHCKRTGSLRHSFIRMKVIKLLLLQAEQYERLRKYPLQTLREDELKRIYQVRDILHDSPAENHTLVALAHKVGTNDATLKKHFKQVFGSTVFSYLTAYRMEMAKKLVLDQNLKIANIAQLVGYKHATHFSAAFKKYFGYLPTKIKLVLLAISAHPEVYVHSYQFS